MPATPPAPFHKDQSVQPNTDPTTAAYPSTGSKYRLRYDKLVIAVGAYNQSELSDLVAPFGVWDSSASPSFQRARRKRTRALSEGYQRCTCYSNESSRVYVNAFRLFRVASDARLSTQVSNKLTSPRSPTTTDGSFFISVSSVRFDHFAIEHRKFLTFS